MKSKEKISKEEEAGRQVLGCMWLLIMGGLIYMWSPLSLFLAGCLLMISICCEAYFMSKEVSK